MTRIHDAGFYIEKNSIGRRKLRRSRRWLVLVGRTIGLGGNTFMLKVMTSWFAIDLDLNCKQTKEKT
jgi:hypothetical protein